MHAEEGPQDVGDLVRANLRTLAEIRADTGALREGLAAAREDLAAAREDLAAARA